ncbi:MAG: thioesterase family protein [Actinomycetia bacterium]|nr:thioesterase family protein [Actinomycetes bacterium]
MSHEAGDVVYVRQIGDEFGPTELARGPWHPNAQHAGAPAALLGWALERELDGPGEQFARLTFDILRPVPIQPLTVRAQRTSGRRVGRWEAAIEVGGQVCMRARALSCATTGIGTSRTPAGNGLPFPGLDRPVRIPGMLTHRSFHYSAMEVKLAAGTTSEAGPAAAWMRLRCPLVAGTPNSPLVRVLAAADFGSGLAWELPFERYEYLNADLSVHLHRLPRGEWVGVAASMTIEAEGTGMVESVLYDTQGRVGVALASLAVLGVRADSHHGREDGTLDHSVESHAVLTRHAPELA